MEIYPFDLTDCPVTCRSRKCCYATALRGEYTGVCLWQTNHFRFRNEYIKVAPYSYVVQFERDLYRSDAPGIIGIR
jgi:hypothetical protein